MSLLEFTIDDLKEIVKLREREEKLKNQIDINQKKIDEMIKKQKLDRKEREKIRDILSNFTDHKRLKNDKNNKQVVKSLKDLKIGDKLWYYEKEWDEFVAAKISQIDRRSIMTPITINYGVIKGTKNYCEEALLDLEDFNKLCKPFDKSVSEFDDLYLFDPTGWKLIKFSINGENIKFNGAGLPNAYLRIAYSLNIKIDDLINNTYESIKCAKEQFRNSRPYEYPIVMNKPLSEAWSTTTTIHIIGISNENCMSQILKMFYNEALSNCTIIKMKFKKGEEGRIIYL